MRREGRCELREGGKLESQTAVQRELAYLAAVECKATNILTSPLATAAFPLFQRYFFLIYRIPQERSISWP